MATKKTAAKAPAADKKPTDDGAQGSVSAMPDGFDAPVEAGTGAVPATPDLPGENTEH